MKILIVSDSHGRHKWLEETIRRVGPVDFLFHLGDSEGYEDYIAELADCPLEIVAGNNDFGHGLERELVLKVMDHRILLTHGHRYYVSMGTNRLMERAKELEADIVMFGHTHVPMIEEREGVWLINPGSISQPRQTPRVPTFILMEIDSQGQVHFTLNQVQ